MPTRRQLLGSSLLAFAGLGLPPARAASATASERKFIFVFAPGGWDPTRVFVPAFDDPNVSMESGVYLETAGSIDYVRCPVRPSVTTFLNAWHERSLVLNGVMVRSIAHDICRMLTMTGTTSGLVPDWPAIIGSRARGSYTMPHLVLGGPSYPGDLGAAVARAGSRGQLDALLTGDALEWSDDLVGAPTAPDESLADRWLARRASARVSGAVSPMERALMEDFAVAVDHAAALKRLRYAMNFTTGAGLTDQVPVGVAALAQGVSRCITMATSDQIPWDSHLENDVIQGPLWESLFAGLGQLMAALAETPSLSGAPLIEETVVVVVSEMGRTPGLNSAQGKDHWPFTSTMLVGPGLTGDRVIGGLDESFYGKLIDPSTGELNPKGSVLSAESVGATLLTLADIDPGEFIDSVDPIFGALT